MVWAKFAVSQDEREGYTGASQIRHGRFGGHLRVGVRALYWGETDFSHTTLGQIGAHLRMW